MNRKSSMDAPIRATVVQKMVETSAANSDSPSRRKMPNPSMTRDLIQFEMTEIEPAVNRSSRSAHFIKMGFQEYRDGNHYKAANTFTKAIEDNSSNWLGYFWRGITFDKVGGYVRALRDFTAAIKYVRKRSERCIANAETQKRIEHISSTSETRGRSKHISLTSSTGTRPPHAAEC